MAIDEGGIVFDEPVPDTTDQAKALIRGLQLRDPKLYECLMLMLNQMNDLTLTLFPIQKELARQVVPVIDLLPPLDLRYLLTKTTVRLSWTAPPIAKLLTYEVRFGSVDWEHSQFILRTQATSVDVNPFIGLLGTFRVKSMNDAGEYSLDDISTNVIVQPPGAVVVQAQVIDNNILLQWTPPDVGSFAIDHYEVRRDGELQGTTKGTFTTYFEVVSGSYVYSITPVDIADNIGLSAEVTLAVNQPPDYVLQDERFSAFLGDKFNVLLSPGPSLLCNVAPQTWQVHFTSRLWLDPQDQKDAGYPIYIQPAELTGWYEEIFDFGVVLNNVIATSRWNFEMITAEGAMMTVVKMAVSDDGVTYTDFTNGPAQFFPSLRFLKFRMEFTGDIDKVLMRVFNLSISLAVKRENDGGEAMALASDLTGTPVQFNKDFKDVESITATAKTPQEPFIVVVDFQDLPDPEGFRVFVFDSMGTRVDKLIEWKARGVV